MSGVHSWISTKRRVLPTSRTEPAVLAQPDVVERVDQDPLDLLGRRLDRGHLSPALPVHHARTRALLTQCARVACTRGRARGGFDAGGERWRSRNDRWTARIAWSAASSTCSTGSRAARGSAIGSIRGSPTSRSAIPRRCHSPGWSTRSSEPRCPGTRTGSPTSSARTSHAASSPTRSARAPGSSSAPRTSRSRPGRSVRSGSRSAPCATSGDEVIFLSPPWFFYELMIESSGATAGPRPARRPRLRPRCRGRGGRDHAADPRDHRQQPEQPDRPDLPRARAGRARRGADRGVRAPRPADRADLGRVVQPDRVRRHRVPQPGPRLPRDDDDLHLRQDAAGARPADRLRGDEPDLPGSRGDRPTGLRSSSWPPAGASRTRSCSTRSATSKACRSTSLRSRRGATGWSRRCARWATR